MPAFALLAASLPLRIASLNLCTDEYLLLLADPARVVSVSYLSQDPLESPLWKLGRRYRGNRGSLEDVIALRPDFVLSMGAGGRASALLGRRMGLRSITLPYANDLADVAVNLRTVASAIGRPQAAEAWIGRLKQLQATAPSVAADAAWVSGGGQSLATGSLGAQWLRLAGYRQRPLAGGRMTLEELLINPPKVLVRSDYRSGQMSAGGRWFDHPIVRRTENRQVLTDGRPWTCMGPLMIPEIERLRKAGR